MEETVYDASPILEKLRRPMVHLIRHGPKAWRNGKKPRRDSGYQHDPPLAAEGREEVRMFLDELNLRSKPTVILCSPYLRCRETAKILAEGADLIQICPGLGEYLGNWKSCDLSPETIAGLAGQNPIERWRDLERRLDRVAEKLMSEPATGDIWIVSHCLVCDGIAKRLPPLSFEKHYFASPGEDQ